MVAYVKRQQPLETEKKDCDQRIQRDENGSPLQKSRFHDEVLTEAAEQLYQDRQEANSLGVTPPGQAEYLDILRVLNQLAPDNFEEQNVLLQTIKEFALKKYPGMQKETSGSKISDKELTAEKDGAVE